MLIFQNGSIEKMINHAEREYPRECCGILLGKRNTNCKAAYRVIETENMAQKEEQRESFLIDPGKMMEIELEAEEQNMEIVGFYHSHPDYDAIASVKDTADMIAGYSGESNQSHSLNKEKTLVCHFVQTSVFLIMNAIIKSINNPLRKH